MLALWTPPQIWRVSEVLRLRAGPKAALKKLHPFGTLSMRPMLYWYPPASHSRLIRNAGWYARFPRSSPYVCADGHEVDAGGGDPLHRSRPRFAFEARPPAAAAPAAANRMEVNAGTKALVALGRGGILAVARASARRKNRARHRCRWGCEDADDAIRKPVNQRVDMRKVASAESLIRRSGCSTNASRLRTNRRTGDPRSPGLRTSSVHSAVPPRGSPRVPTDSAHRDTRRGDGGTGSD